MPLRHPSLAALLVTGLIAAAGAPAMAAGFLPKLRPAKAAAPTVQIGPDQIAAVRRALDEQRLLDAGRMIDQLSEGNTDNANLRLLTGELALRRGRNEDALVEFAKAEASPATAAAALEGRGIALARLNRTDDAIETLKKAVAADPSAWRAWNALGSSYDLRRQWSAAEEAYGHALAGPTPQAIVLNNRGYSRLLQGRRGEATDDFVAALERKPDLAEARTNLRLALALGGEYDRSMAGVSAQDQAAQLNNLGFAAAVRGDYTKAQDYLERALAARGEFYDRAAENLKIVRGLESGGSSK